MNAKSRYDTLKSERSQYLNIAEESSRLTIPYLIHEDETKQGMRTL